MRKSLEAVCGIAFFFQVWITLDALWGPHRLPARIAIHFDLAGNPNGWGSPGSLAILPLVTLGLYLLVTVLSGVPDLFNYPVEVTDENRERLQAISIQLLRWIKTEVVCLFAWISWMCIQGARIPTGKMAPYSIFGSVTICFVVVIIATIVFSAVSMGRNR